MKSPNRAAQKKQRGRQFDMPALEFYDIGGPCDVEFLPSTLCIQLLNP